MTTPAKKPTPVQTSASPAAPHPAATPAPDMDALPPGGGSYTRQPDGTLVPNPAADTTTPAATPLISE